MKRTLLVSLGFFLLLVVAFTSFVLNTKPIAQAQDPTDTTSRYQTGQFTRAMVYDGVFVWTANWYDNTITQLAAEDGRVLDTIADPTLTFGNQTAPGNGPVALAWDGNLLWAANPQTNIVYLLHPDLKEMQNLFQRDISNPVALFFDNIHVWVLNQGRGNVAGHLLKIDARSQSPVGGRFQVGRFPTAMAWDGTNMWVTNGLDNTVSVLNADTGELVKNIRVNSFPMSIAYDGINMWIAHYDGSVMLVDSRTLEEPEAVKVDNLPGQPPRPVQIMYAFECIWITNVHAGNFSILQAINGEVRREEAVLEPSIFPGTIAYTDDEVWVADWITQTITTFNPEPPCFPTLNPEPAVLASPGLWLPSPEPTATPTATNTPEQCHPDLPSRLVIGGRGMVNSEFSNQRLVLRDAPSSFSNVIESYPAGTSFDVLGGPVCEDGHAFFNVKLDDGTEGWFREDFNGSYTVDPIE